MKPFKFLIVAMPLLLAGCYMTNDEIIIEVKKCNDAGMKAEMLRDGLSWRVIGVICLPKETKP